MFSNPLLGLFCAALKSVKSPFVANRHTLQRTFWCLTMSALIGMQTLHANLEEEIDLKPRASASQKIARVAKAAVGESSKSGPAGGKLACAWMVNKMLRRAIRRAANGDSTSTMDQVLRRWTRSGRARKVSKGSAKAGDIVISPTVWKPKRRTGHVGIMASSSRIYSNSSTRRKWLRNYTVGSWSAYYGHRKGLKVNFYKILR